MIWVRGDWRTYRRWPRGDVAHIYANPTVQVDEPDPAAAAPDAAACSADAIEWNITKVHAPEVWAAGFTGQGVVIGGQDTGYQWNHPALKGKYRGWNGTTANHDYNWHDAIHGTGISCGAQLPGALRRPRARHAYHGDHGRRRWRGQPDRHGAGREVDRLPQHGRTASARRPPTAECYQWFIAPTKLDGTSPRLEQGARRDQQLVGLPAQRGLHRPQRACSPSCKP